MRLHASSLHARCVNMHFLCILGNNKHIFKDLVHLNVHFYSLDLSMKGHLNAVFKLISSLETDHSANHNLHNSHSQLNVWIIHLFMAPSHFWQTQHEDCASLSKWLFFSECLMNGSTRSTLVCTLYDIATWRTSLQRICRFYF